MNKLFIIIILFLTAISFSKTRKNNVILELVNADKNSNRMSNGSIESTLYGNVIFKWGETTIKTDSTIWQRGSGKVNLNGSVEVTRFRQIMRCKNAVFNTSEQLLKLLTGVVAIDSSSQVTLTADSCFYYIQPDSLYVWQEPKMYLWALSTTDSFTVASKFMNYVGSKSLAISYDSVDITGPNIKAACDSAIYLQKEDILYLTGNNPWASYLTNYVYGDTISLIFDSSQLSSMVVWGNPKAIMIDTAGSKSDTAYLRGDSLLFIIKDDALHSVKSVGSGFLKEIEGDSSIIELKGDSLEFIIADGGLDSVISTGNSETKQYRKGDELSADNAFGDKIIIDFLGDGSGVAKVLDHGRAKLLSDKSSINEVAGDTIILNFDSDGVLDITLFGGVQGVILEQEGDPNDSTNK